MTEPKNKDTTPPAVVPSPPFHFIAPILTLTPTPPGFQATSNNYQYQSWINYSTACALQQFYWNQLLASFVSPSTLATMVVPTNGAHVPNIKMEDLQQVGGREQSHHHQSVPSTTAPAPLNLPVAVKSEIAVDTKAPPPPPPDASVVTPVAFHDLAEDKPSLPAKKSKDFICGLCDRGFGYKHSLRNHWRTHTGEKPFGCSVCQRKFARNHHLTTHMRQHTGEKPYECPDCDGKFVQYANLQRHFVRMHEEAGISEEKKCGMCTKVFSDRLKLSSHVKKCHKKPEVGSSSLEKQ